MTYFKNIANHGGAVLFALILTLLTISTAAAESRYYSTLFGTAVHGYDVVSYFTDGMPVEGDSDFSVNWQGSEWHFVSAEHKKMFEASPEKYAPQYGGYCAWAVSQGYTASSVPEAWRIVDGKLYLNYSKGVQSTWAEDVPGNIAKADKNWPGIEKDLK